MENDKCRTVIFYGTMAILAVGFTGIFLISAIYKTNSPPAMNDTAFGYSMIIAIVIYLCLAGFYASFYRRK